MADDIARMRAALNDGSSVTVQGISPEQLSAMQAASQFTKTNLSAPPKIEAPSFDISVPSLDDISNFFQKIPEQAQRFLTNPQAFTQAITGKNLLPEQTGFAASTTGLPPENPNSILTPEGSAYSTGYRTGEPFGIASMALPFAGAVAKPTSKMLAEMAHNQVMNTGGIKMPFGLPEIPVANYAVKPGGGNNPINLGDPKGGAMGKYLDSRTYSDPMRAWQDLLPNDAITYEFKDFANKWIETFGNGIKPSDIHLENNTATAQKAKQLWQEAAEKFSEIINEGRVNQGLPPIIKPSSVEQILPHFNEWVSQGPHKKYITSQFGAGIPRDPVLGAIDKYNLPLTTERKSDFVEGSGQEARRRAAQIVEDAKNVYGIRLEPKPFENVGKQTATSPEGMYFENASDAMTWPRHAVPMFPDHPFEKKLKMGEPIYDLASVDTYDKKTGLPEIRKELLRSLATGEIPIENLKNVGVERIAEKILQGKQAEQKAIQKSKEAYTGWRQQRHQQLPADETFTDGTKMVIFDKAVADANPEMLARDLSVDTKDLNHCLVSCGHNVGEYQHAHVPMVEPHTGLPPKGADQSRVTGYLDRVKNGRIEIASLRDSSGQARATMEFSPTQRRKMSDSHKEFIIGTTLEDIDPKAMNVFYNDIATMGHTRAMEKAMLEHPNLAKKIKEAEGANNISIDQIKGYEDGPISPEYVPYVKTWMNKNADRIKHVSITDIKNLPGIRDTKTGINEISDAFPQFDEYQIKQLFSEIYNQQKDQVGNELRQIIESYGHVIPPNVNPVDSLLSKNVGVVDALMRALPNVPKKIFAQYHDLVHQNPEEFLASKMPRFIDASDLRNLSKQYGVPLQKEGRIGSDGLKELRNERDKMQRMLDLAENTGENEVANQAREALHEIQLQIDAVRQNLNP
jgi:hypothetical protein